MSVEFRDLSRQFQIDPEDSFLFIRLLHIGMRNGISRAELMGIIDFWHQTTGGCRGIWERALQEDPTPIYSTSDPRHLPINEVTNILRQAINYGCLGGVWFQTSIPLENVQQIILDTAEVTASTLLTLAEEFDGNIIDWQQLIFATEIANRNLENAQSIIRFNQTQAVELLTIMRELSISLSETKNRVFIPAVALNKAYAPHVTQKLERRRGDPRLTAKSSLEWDSRTQLLKLRFRFYQSLRNFNPSSKAPTGWQLNGLLANMEEAWRWEPSGWLI